ncbi:MAG TPA: TPM domain-containing protein [Tepidisphaeraceae bacterium]|nr:TPM domain-containing protein [Tepidisphaeraceae bacterium]
MQNRDPRLTLCFTAILLLVALRSNAASNGIRDEAKFFSADAIDQAQQIIRQIDHQHQHDVLVETVPQVPNDQKDEFSRLGKEKFFELWAEARATQQGVNGVYILVCRNPSRLQVAVGNITSKRLFTIDDRNVLAKLLIDRFRQKQFDQGLLDAVRFVQRKMAEHHTPEDDRATMAWAPPQAKTIRMPVGDRT